MTVNIEWSQAKEKWDVDSTTEGHIAYRKTLKNAKKLAKGQAQTEADSRGVQVQIRWHYKDGTIAGDKLVYPTDTEPEDRVK